MEDLKALVAVGLVFLLILLRLQAEEFGAAEYDEVFEGEKPPFRRRLAWYVIGVAIVVAVYNIHPAPRDTLNLVTGRRLDALTFGTGFAMIGVAQAVAFALYRYGDLRLPPTSAYPDAALNTIGTAFIDEVTFRGILLGMMLAVGVNESVAIAVQAIVYALATRTGAKGRHPYMLLVILGIGFIGGWVTLRTGGIGAAFFGNAVTRFSLFVCTGHPGRVVRRGEEPEDSWFRRPAPTGWRDARVTAGSRYGAEPRDLQATRAADPRSAGAVENSHSAVPMGPPLAAAATVLAAAPPATEPSPPIGVSGAAEDESSAANVRRRRGAHPRGEATTGRGDEPGE